VILRLVALHEAMYRPQERGGEEVRRCFVVRLFFRVKAELWPGLYLDVVWRAVYQDSPPPMAPTSAAGAGALLTLLPLLTVGDPLRSAALGAWCACA
jgi:hypothetical protein